MNARLSATEPTDRPSLRLDALPAMPGDGTTLCGDRCDCEWYIRVVDEDRGHFDATWMVGSSTPCATCRQRSEHWIGLEVRGGTLASDPKTIFDG